MERPRERSDPGASSLSIRGFLSRGLSIGQNSSRMNINLLRGSWFQALARSADSSDLEQGHGRPGWIYLAAAYGGSGRPIFSPVAAADDYPRLPLSANHPTFILGSELPLIYTPSLAPGVGSATHHLTIVLQSSQRATTFHPLCFNFAGRYSQIIYKPGY